MNINDYPDFCRSIWYGPVEAQTTKALAVAGLGLIGECSEVCEQLLLPSCGEIRAATIDECGDVLYYLTVLADWKDLTLADIHAKSGWMKPSMMSRSMSGLDLCARGKEVSERVKKFIRDDREFTQAEMITFGGELLVALNRVLMMAHSNLQGAIDVNVAKLEVRYAEVLIPLDALHEATGGKS